MAGAGQQFFDDSEAEEILRRAVSGTPTMGGMSRESLLQAAAELGVSPEAVDRAAAEVVREREEKDLLAQFRRHQRSDFVGHLLTYLAVNGGFILFMGFQPWMWWMIGPWGLGLLGDLRQTFAINSSDHFKEFEKWKRRRNGRKVLDSPIAGLGSASDVSGALDEYFLSHDPNAKLEAIKYVRERTGFGLKEAKDAVDTYYAAHGWN
jgi:2TM domain/Ribosomal protein L7/L12 C-terminal domain